MEAVRSDLWTDRDSQQYAVNTVAMMQLRGWNISDSHTRITCVHSLQKTIQNCLRNMAMCV